MAMQCYCEGCDGLVEVDVAERTEVFPVRGEDVSVEGRVAICRGCGEDVFSEDLDGENLERAFAEYRRLHGFMSPTEIRQLRNAYGISQKAFSLLLGMGAITLHRYEAGALPTVAHDALLQLMQKPENLRTLLERNGARLDASTHAALAARLDDFAEEGLQECAQEVLLQERHAPSELSGYKKLDLVRLNEAILFFASQPRMFVTKLAKMLFYSDFLHFKEFTTSITGLQYAHLPYGPVPDKYDWIRGEASSSGLITYEEQNGENWSGELVLANRAPNLDVFTDDERAVLEFVAKKFEAMPSKALSDQSHDEDAYKGTETGEIISYDTALTLSLSL